MKTKKDNSETGTSEKVHSECEKRALAQSSGVTQSESEPLPESKEKTPTPEWRDGLMPQSHASKSYFYFQYPDDDRVLDTCYYLDTFGYYLLLPRCLIFAFYIKNSKDR